MTASFKTAKGATITIEANGSKISCAVNGAAMKFANYTADYQNLGDVLWIEMFNGKKVCAPIPAADRAAIEAEFDAASAAHREENKEEIAALNFSAKMHTRMYGRYSDH